MRAVRRVRLMSDYAADWPLWTDEQGLLAPDALPLPEGLAADLRAWQDLFERGFSWDGGWGDTADEERYVRDGVQLLHRLRRELGPSIQVDLDLWPVSTPRLRAWVEHRGRLD